MPRLARLDSPGVLHHVMIRGIERRKIFRDNKDRDNLIERLSTILPETNTSCYAWSLMPNHAHFLFRSGKYGISKVMCRLLTGYALSFNRRYNRHGQLFQNRYKSIICQEDKYLLELVRYIHLNPLRANIVSDISELNKYPYSGHSSLTNNRNREWQDTGYIMGYFGRNLSKARKGYLEFVESGIKLGRRPELVGGGMIRSLGGWTELKRNPLNGNDRIKSDERILGDSGFVQQILSEANDELDRRYRLKSQGYDIEKVEKRVIEVFGVKRDELYSGSRKHAISLARSVFCYWCVRELGESMTCIAKRMNLTQPAVGYAVDRGEMTVKNSKIQLIMEVF
ncbi:MAG: transposase [Deltaproteobacteria bacterium]|nr:transposase [Deltaproteobacteria bacterium]